MKINNRSLCTVFIIFLLIFLLSGSVRSDDEDTLIIGVLVGDDQQRPFERMSGMSEYLSSDITEFTFEIVPLDYHSMDEEIVAGNIDFLIVDPATYVILEKTHGISSIATMETIAYLPSDYTQKVSVHQVGSVIFTKAERTDIDNIGDLSGLSLLALETPSSEGWWTTRMELEAHKIDYENDLGTLEFRNDPESIVLSIVAGEFDAGNVPSGILEKMHMEGKIDINDLNVLHSQSYDNYPLLVSTGVYPGWVFAKTQHTSKSISERVSVSLLSMPFNISGSDSIGDVAGWTVPQDYTPVENILSELQVGPFQPKIDPIGLIMEFRYFLLGISFLLVLAGASVIYVNNLNSKLEKEIAAKTEAETILKRKHMIEKTMFTISSMFTYPGDVDEAIDTSLMEIGTLCGAGRCYLFVFNEDGTQMSNTHEWCSAGVDPQKDELQDLPSDMFPWWMARLQDDQMVNISDVSAMPPEASAEKEILEMQDIKSILVLPVFIEGILVGFVGIDDVNGTKEWEMDDFDTLHMFSTMMAMVIKRRKMEKSLMESEQHLKRVLEGSNEGTWDADIQEDRIVFNDRYAEILGYPVDEVGTYYEWMNERIHPDDAHHVHEKIEAVHKGNTETAESEYRVRGKDGQYRWVFNKGKVVEYSKDGKPLHMAGILVDISDRKAAEEALIAAKDAAEDASRIKSEFLANMSHELRTPLNSVIGFSDILLEGTFGSLNDKQKRYVGNISKSGKHLLTLINDILDLSKVEAGKMTLNIEEFDVGGSLDDIRSIVSPLALKKDIGLVVELVPETILLKADKGKFKQIIYNLLSNAIKFTDAGGTVGISVTEQDNHILVNVTDTGIGITEEDQQKLFKAFTQIDSSTCRVYEGTGLGLALVKSFIELHGGRIWVESECGRGSSFLFELPLEPVQFPGPEEIETVIMSEGSLEDRSIADPDKVDKGPLVLVVEDEVSSQEILAITLKNAGYDVRFASDGKEALELARELQPFAITLDIMMPKIDGWGVLKQLKHEKRTENIPVVIVSILNEKDLGIIWGAFDYMVKPVDREALLSSLERLRELRSFEQVNVLVIDDEPSVIELMESMLSNEGYDIMSASNGKEGIERALSFLPDVIILDLMMPKVDGFDVISELKKHPETIDIPIIVCTAKDLEAYEKEQLDRDVSFVMQKGIFSKQDLLGCIKSLEKLSK
ncbi:response regulator [Methanolobus profundi]|uniref:histidine kinase n=1 Tax=Methanolobus profundi TaxID=487685 RepID=A0A1I4NXH6_9EURY|nr:response regulator [Methanolobus profundi]SFM20264.1 PAS domain S-box-containing protein [Methanolobus profundi]